MLVAGLKFETVLCSFPGPADPDTAQRLSEGTIDGLVECQLGKSDCKVALLQLA